MEMLDYEIQDDWIRLLLLSPYWKEKSFELNPGMDPLRHGPLMTNIITKVADGSSFARASACVGLGRVGMLKNFSLQSGIISASF